MIKVDKILEIVKIVLASGYLRGEKPLSLVLISDVESGKTQIIRKYCLKTDGIMYTTDATAYGIIRDSNNLKDFEEGKYKHIVIPDLLTCMARRETTVNTLIHFMNSLIEEGVVNVSTFATKIKKEDKRKVEVKVGLITSIAKIPFFEKKHRWSSVGFLSRVLPVSYSYTLPTRLEILEFVENQKHLEEALEKLKFNKKPRRVILPYEYAKMLEPYTLSVAKAQEIYGFRIQKQFQTMLKSIAYLRGSDVVETQDFDKFKEIVTYVNLDFNKV